MQATTPIGSRTATPACTVEPDLARRERCFRNAAREIRVLLQADRDGAHLLRLRDALHGAGLRDRDVDERAHLRAERIGDLLQERAALGARHRPPRAALERVACRARRRSCLRGRRFRRAPRDRLGRGVDDGIGPLLGRHPRAADEDLVADELAHGSRSGRARLQLLLAIAGGRVHGSLSNSGSTCFPNVSMDVFTYFWSIVSVNGA
jgi:hypothetical protein